MTTIETPTGTPRPPWPFTGREEELELVRRSSAAGRPGIVLTGPAGCGRTRLAAEAVRGTDCARAAGTPGTRGTAFAAFAPLLPEGVTLHRAVQLLSSVRLLLVDDAHLLDDASAALLHQLAVRGRTRLLVVVTEGAGAPAAVTRLWTGDLLPRLSLEPLPVEDTAPLLAADADGPLDPLTVDRLHRLCRGDLRLLRDLLAAVRDEGLLTPLPGSGERAWRGRIPLTPTLRDRAAPVLARPCPDERETLDRLAFAEPLSLPADTLDLRVLERLEADGLIEADDGEPTTVRLAHPLYGPVLRAAAGRLRARRLTATRRPLTDALDAEAAALAEDIARADLRAGTAPVGEWLVAEGQPVPPAYAAVRARHARLRGAPREAAAWASQGLTNPTSANGRWAEGGVTGTAPLRDGGVTGTAPLRDGGVTGTVPHRDRGAAGHGAPPAIDRPPAADRRPGDRAVAESACRRELRLAAVELGEVEPVGNGEVYDAVRLGAPERALGLLPDGSVFARHARALADADGPALDRVAEELAGRGFLLFAAEAYAQAVRVHRDPTAARTARTRAVALARRCQGARTPALSGLALGELTARQRQIVTLAAAGLSNRQIAERLTLSVRTVGNHLYGAYTRLGAGDRAALPWLMDQPA
ncbi:LuxR C-terminal-related transcriptional regulator [Streptomyces sp. NBC_00582]|uniref:LuxR C-terminal-related transcriptional regulator n=1 Tax=Streptomyces sp. NBC_00582 TaxID=2975783 RepID=UPI002E817148|nr:LuxR C-terminal-related transcriptional regulator [Streptomyces sp. NBC_00582]WUB60266.1 helix-turn-helix transcriptional regulator [Streptomyces sp. NBC_00582]